MTEHFCQSCGMPMGDTDALYGLQADGSKSKDYCHYCYENGEFTFQGTMEEMVEICLPHMLSNNKNMEEDAARTKMLEWFPMLKRWKQ